MNVKKDFLFFGISASERARAYTFPLFRNANNRAKSVYRQAAATVAAAAVPAAKNERKMAWKKFHELQTCDGDSRSPNGESEKCVLKIHIFFFWAAHSFARPPACPAYHVHCTHNRIEYYSVLDSLLRRSLSSRPLSALSFAFVHFFRTVFSLGHIVKYVLHNFLFEWDE